MMDEFRTGVDAFAHHDAWPGGGCISDLFVFGAARRSGSASSANQKWMGRDVLRSRGGRR